LHGIIKEGADVPSFILSIKLLVMNIEKRVAELVEEKIADKPNLFLVDVKMHLNGKLAILLDGDNGVGIDDCVAVSRYVGFKLEEDNVIETAYNLEVSSPGIDTPLTSLRQYSKNIGREVALKMLNNTKREGKLLAATEEQITIEEKIKQKGKKAELVENAIPLNEIAETKVLISFK
jgi:ribosome maturation factor RimP